MTNHSIHPGTSICLSINCHALLHLCYHWHAGMFIVWFVSLKLHEKTIDKKSKYNDDHFLYILQMFGNIKVDHASTIHNHNNFQNIFQATLVLFRQEESRSVSMHIIILLIRLLFTYHLNNYFIISFLVM